MSGIKRYLKIGLLIAFILLTVDSEVADLKTNCDEDGSVVVYHEDIQFTFFHNHTHNFARYQVQANFSLHVNRSSRPSGETFKFLLHGRCPSWATRLNNGSYIVDAVTGQSVKDLRISCCSDEKDTMMVQFGSGSLHATNFSLVLARIEERTESDLVGVTRIPIPDGPLVGGVTRANHSGGAMVMTNFHDIFARHAFPLVDSLTSLYTVALTIVVDETSRPRYWRHNDELTVLANTQLASTTTRYQGRGPSRARIQTWTFEPTPPMPGSYLAFVIGRFHRNKGLTKRRIEINVWSMPGLTNHVDSTRFALEMSTVLMDYFEHEFDFPYPLPKLDIVEAPLDYEAFVVWGLCFVKPGRLHVSKQSSSTGSDGFFGGAQALRETIPKKKELLETLAHEISHQWFGSLVTPRTWNDVFLSESFATFYGVEAIRFAKGVPQWMASEAMITALTHRKISLHTDHTIPISSPVMYKNWSRDVQFSTIVYHKGATLLRMLKWVIGEKTFRDGVRRYLKRFRYSNAGADDFLTVFDETVRRHRIPGWNEDYLDVAAFLRPYLYQPSYPIVLVKVNKTHATLTQEPHHPSQRVPGSVTYQWYIPITVHLQSKHMKTYWLKPNDTLCLPVTDFGFMVRLFHLYAIRPSHEEEGEEAHSEDDDVLD